MIKTLITAILLIFCLQQIANAPNWRIVKKWFRITAYSCKERGEVAIGCRNNSIRNEMGVACNSLPFGTIICLPNGDLRVVNDKTSEWADDKFNGQLMDVHWYRSIKSKPKTRAVSRELYKFDMGWDWVEIYYPE